MNSISLFSYYIGPLDTVLYLWNVRDKAFLESTFFSWLTLNNSGKLKDNNVKIPSRFADCIRGLQY